MSGYKPADSDFEQRVRDSFSRQNLMATLGSHLDKVEPGIVEIRLPVRSEISQQHGFVHAGAIASIADSACGYAAATLLDKDVGVLAVEFKINLLAPGAGDYLIARGRVIRSGRTLSVCQADVFAVTGDTEKVIAVMTATIMNVRGREGVVG
ncbi:MAG TPA: PaaI family thioesterase [Gemmatimonadaceae bacterium]